MPATAKPVACVYIYYIHIYIYMDYCMCVKVVAWSQRGLGSKLNFIFNFQNSYSFKLVTLLNAFTSSRNRLAVISMFLDYYYLHMHLYETDNEYNSPNTALYLCFLIIMSTWNCVCFPCLCLLLRKFGLNQNSSFAVNK